MLAKHPLESGPRSGRLHIEQRPAREQVPAVVVQQGQRIAVDAVASLELALEIDRPDLVRSIGVPEPVNENETALV
jgi:Lhr-like helicase